MKKKTKFTDADLVVARVLHEDERSMTLEILKDRNAPIHLNQGLPGGQDAPPDQFFTMLFASGKPWEK